VGEKDHWQTVMAWGDARMGEQVGIWEGRMCGKDKKNFRGEKPEEGKEKHPSEGAFHLRDAI